MLDVVCVAAYPSHVLPKRAMYHKVIAGPDQIASLGDVKKRRCDRGKTTLLTKPVHNTKSSQNGCNDSLELLTLSTNSTIIVSQHRLQVSASTAVPTWSSARPDMG